MYDIMLMLKVATTEVPTIKNLHCFCIISHQISDQIFKKYHRTLPLHAHVHIWSNCTYICVFLLLDVLCACPYAVTSAVTKETPWGGEEVPKGVRHGEERHVVHSLSLEKSLSEIHRLIQSPSSVHEMSSSSFRSNCEVGLFHWGHFFTKGLFSAASSSEAGGSPSLFFRFQTQRENKSGEYKQTKRKKISKKKELYAGLETFFEDWDIFTLLMNKEKIRKKKRNF